MKNSTNNNVNDVPSIHTGCSMAETGRNDYDDFDNPLKPMDIIPEAQKNEVLVERRTQCQGYDGPYEEIEVKLLPEFRKPASVREESHITLYIPSGVHFLDLFKEKSENLEKTWIFLHKDVVEELRKFPIKFYHDSVAYGEIFRLKNDDSFSLQEVEFYHDWKVLLNCEIDDKKISRCEKPEVIIQLELIK